MAKQKLTEKPAWLNGTVCPTFRFRVKQGWAANIPVSIVQQLMRPTNGGHGWWVDLPTVALETSDAE